MARGYTVATAALALNTTTKWVDNVLSHFLIPGVSQSRQGVARKISVEAVFLLALLNRLSESLKIPIEIALGAATELAADGKSDIGQGLSFQLDQEGARESLRAKLEYAVEAAPLPRRGRPPTNAKRGA